MASCGCGGRGFIEQAHEFLDLTMRLLEELPRRVHKLGLACATLQAIESSRAHKARRRLADSLRKDVVITRLCQLRQPLHRSEILFATFGVAALSHHAHRSEDTHLEPSRRERLTIPKLLQCFVGLNKLRTGRSALYRRSRPEQLRSLQPQCRG